jgi:hypothetical protein
MSSIAPLPIKNVAATAINPFARMMQQAQKNPDQDLQQFKNKKRKLEKKNTDKARHKVMKDSMNEKNKANRLLERNIKIDIENEHSSQLLPKSWLAQPWPYSHTNTDDLDLQLISPDYQDIPSYSCPAEYRDIHRLPRERQQRTNPYPEWPEGCRNMEEAMEDKEFAHAVAQYKKGPSERNVKVPVLRCMSAPQNGCPTAVRFHGWRPSFFVPVADELARIVLANEFPEIKDYPYGKRNLI